MAKLSIIAPYTKKGAMTFTLGAGGDFATPAQFFEFLDNSSFGAGADVLLEIKNGTVISTPFIVEGNYDYLTIGVEAGGTAYVDSDNLPKYQPFPVVQPTVQLPWFIYNRWLEYDWGGKVIPNYGLRGIYGRFEKIGSQSVTFAMLDAGARFQFGLSVITPSFGTEVPLDLVNFDQNGYFSAAYSSGILRTTCPTPAVTTINFGSYLNINSSLGFDVNIEPYGNIVVGSLFDKFLLVSSSNYGNITFYAGAVPFNITASTFIESTASGREIEVNASTKPGSGGSMSNCQVTCNQEFFSVNEGELVIGDSIPFVSDLQTHSSSDYILAFLGINAKLSYKSFSGGGVSQTIGINFDAALGPGGMTPLIYGQRGSTVIYPDSLTLNDLSGTFSYNVNKVALGSNSGDMTHAFITTTSVQDYHQKLTNNQLSVQSALNGGATRVMVLDQDPNSWTSYGVTSGFSFSDVASGITLGDWFNTRPQDALSNGRFILSGGSNFFYTAPSSFSVNLDSLPPEVVIECTGSGGIMDIDSYTLGYTTYFNMAAGMSWDVRRNAFTHSWSDTLRMEPVVGDNFISYPHKQVNLVATGALTSRDLVMDGGFCPGYSIRITNTSAFTISGNLKVPSDAITVPYSLAAAASITVVFDWDSVSSVRTLTVT